MTNVPRKNIDACHEGHLGIKGATVKTNLVHILGTHTHTSSRNFKPGANYLPYCILILFDVKMSTQPLLPFIKPINIGDFVCVFPRG